MDCIYYYDSPLGRMLASSDDEGLTGLWFIDQKHYADKLSAEKEERLTPAIRLASAWLDMYFSGLVPDITVPLNPRGTGFQKSVWNALCSIPYGKTASYGSIAASLGSSARAVGSAVGRNPISLIIPCHRVIGADGSITGYAGGIGRKMMLLKAESGSGPVRSDD